MNDDKHTSPIELTQTRRTDAAFGYRAGEVIEGKYELVKLLERGRVTALWAVQDLVLDTQFALEMLANDGSDPLAVDHMLRRARAAASVEHPAVIRVSDFGVTHRGDPFIVTELLRGGTVQELLRARRRFSPPEAVRLLLPIAEALELVHAHGGVHRNIKPENIVCIQGSPGRVQPKLIAFGIAGPAPVDSPEYLAPEQSEDDPTVDQRSDIWSFSAVLYEMLTGSSPFHRETPALTLRAIKDDPILPLARAGVFDEPLSAMVLRGLERAPDARWQDIRSYARALAEWLIFQGVEDDSTGQSVRAIWLRDTPSAPPVAMDQGAENQHFPGAEDAYAVPKNRLWRTAAGFVGASITLAAIFTTGVFATGAFGTDAPTTARGAAPWLAEDEVREMPLPALGSSLADQEISGSKEAGADAQDAALDPFDAQQPKPRARLGGRMMAAPAWRAVPGNSTWLPTPQPPPDLGPSEPPVKEDESAADQPYGD